MQSGGGVSSWEPWSLAEKIVAGVVTLLVVAGFAFLIHRDGERQGAVKQELKVNAGHVQELRAAAVVVRAKTVAKRKEYRAARAKVVVKGDTVIADGKTVELPSVASLIRVADSRGAQDSTDMAKQDLLIATLGQRVNLLERVKEPRCGRKCGIAIGVAGTGAVLYVAIRIIGAARHK